MRARRAAAAARERSSLMTSDGHEPTRNSVRMSGRRASSCATHAVELVVARRRGRRGRAPRRIAVAKRGSAKIITPAADWMRCAHVREPTTRKKASCILRCSHTMPVRPQNTSRWPALAEHRERRRRASAPGAAQPSASGRSVALTRPPAARRGPAPPPRPPRGAQLEQELRGVDRVDGVRRERDVHQRARREEAARAGRRGRAVWTRDAPPSSPRPPRRTPGRTGTARTPPSPRAPR